MPHHTQDIAHAIDSASTYFKNHPTYCTLKVMSCLKEVVDEPTWEGKREFFDKAVSDKGIFPHLSPDDYASGVESILAISMSSMPDKFRKRAERKIRAYDLSNLGEVVKEASRVAPMAQRRLKVVGEFSEKYPEHSRSKNLSRRVREQSDEIIKDILQLKDVTDHSLKSLYFGKGYHHEVEGMAATLHGNGGVQQMLGSLMRSYDDYVNELAVNAGMTPIASSKAISNGKISLWSRVKENVGASVGSAINVAKQAAAVLAIGIMGMSSLQSDKAMESRQVESNLQEVAYSLPEGMAFADINKTDHSDIKADSVEEIAQNAPPLSGSSGEIDKSILEAVQISHIMDKGENVWDVARGYLIEITGGQVSNQAVADLLEQSKLTDSHHVTPGETITFSMDYGVLEEDIRADMSP